MSSVDQGSVEERIPSMGLGEKKGRGHTGPGGLAFNLDIAGTFFPVGDFCGVP